MNTPKDIEEIRRENDEIVDQLNIDLRALEDQLRTADYQVFAEVPVVSGWSLAHVPPHRDKKSNLRLHLLPSDPELRKTEAHTRPLINGPLTMKMVAAAKIPELFEQIHDVQAFTTNDLKEAVRGVGKILDELIAVNKERLKDE